VTAGTGEIMQIPLPFKAAERASFDSFQGDVNTVLVQQLHRTAAGESVRNVYIWGEAGTGKSHLLHATCNEVSSRGGTAALVPLSQSRELSPSMLEGLEQMDLVSLDDLDRIAAVPAWEQAVFGLFNRMRELEKPLVMTCRFSPRGIPVELPDLASRLAWDLVYRVAPLDEASLLQVLRQRGAMRGMEVPDEVLQYLSRRVPRDVHTLFQWLDKMDEASLSAKKKLTVPFIRDLLSKSRRTD
jgi:DnaA family protein